MPLDVSIRRAVVILIQRIHMRHHYYLVAGGNGTEMGYSHFKTRGKLTRPQQPIQFEDSRVSEPSLMNKPGRTSLNSRNCHATGPGNRCRRRRPSSVPLGGYGRPGNYTQSHWKSQCFRYKGKSFERTGLTEQNLLIVFSQRIHQTLGYFHPSNVEDESNFSCL